MERSLNSSRNFKLPPIQGAAPAASILRQIQPQATTRHDSGSVRSVAVPSRRSVASRPVVHVPKDPFPGRYRTPYSSHLSSGNVSNSVLNGANENTKNTKLTLEISALGRQFPQSYSVLPPISKIRQRLADEGENRTASSRDTEENSSGNDSKSAGVNNAVSNKHTFKDVRKQQHKRTAGESIADESLGTDEKTKTLQTEKDRSEAGEEKKVKERKPSATMLLFLKGDRKGRRVGVCVENEPSLINVTERLKEIFLRRNMEEMYLI